MLERKLLNLCNRSEIRRDLKKEIEVKAEESGGSEIVSYREK